MRGCWLALVFPILWGVMLLPSYVLTSAVTRWSLGCASNASPCLADGRSIMLLTIILSGVLSVLIGVGAIRLMPSQQ